MRVRCLVSIKASRGGITFVSDPHSGYIRKRRAVQAAGVHGRRLSALMAARVLPIARPVSRSVGENKYIDVPMHRMRTIPLAVSRICRWSLKVIL